MKLSVWLLSAALICGLLSSCRLSRASEVDSTSPAGAKNLPVVYSRHYTVRLGGFEHLHSFDIHKYRKIHRKLVTEGVIPATSVAKPHEITEEELLRVHTPEFLESLKSPKTVGEYLGADEVRFLPRFVIDRRILKAFRYSTGGTTVAARRALEEGIAVNLGGGYAHAKPGAGEGFNIYADTPIAIRTLQEEGAIRRALVIDLDIHQGNGTIVCFEGDDSVFCFSMHQRNLYPHPKEEGDYDLEIGKGLGDEEYLSLLGRHLPKVFQKAGEVDMVFYVAGCDPLDGDPLADSKMSIGGIVERDLYVIDSCRARGLPVAMTLSGGYSKNAWMVQYESIRAIAERLRETDSAGD